jgi:hypothetical protein
MARYPSCAAVSESFTHIRRPDVIGKAVNVAAMLDSTGVTVSTETFRKLGSDVRARFKKHTPPITYIRLQDPRRSRSATHA